MKHLPKLSTALLLFIQLQVFAQSQTFFDNYWYGGEAEITSYALQQARYGEVHSGEAVLVFVTEPFSKKKQVKLDNWRTQSTDKINVMKLNFTKKFLTGIYPYSLMMSTFTEVESSEFTNVYKVTTSAQEWCGHSWLQLNLEGKETGESDYKVKGFSYFESEGDIDDYIPNVVLEDEIWTRIRLSPEALPVGEVVFFPSTFYVRLRHKALKHLDAEASLKSLAKSDFSDQPHQQYSIVYDERTLDIYFEKNFPHAILGWEETYLSGYGSPEKLTTRAMRINTVKSAYWGKNTNADRKLRKELGLSESK